VYGFRKCGRRDNIAQEKPHAPRLAERVSKDTGVGGSQDAESASCGPCIPLRKAWNQQRAWHRPGENTHAWMRSLSYSSSITVLTESELRSISQRIAYRGVAEEAVGLQPWRSVTNELNASIPIEPIHDPKQSFRTDIRTDATESSTNVMNRAAR